jgi:hypothetical protein
MKSEPFSAQKSVVKFSRRQNSRREWPIFGSALCPRKLVLQETDDDPQKRTNYSGSANVADLTEWL